MKITAYLVHETPAAMLVTPKPKGSPNNPQIWIPRSVIDPLHRHGGPAQRMTLTLKGWWADGHEDDLVPFEDA